MGTKKLMDGLTVGDLLDALANLPRDMPVILQEDAEGNGYRQAHGCDHENLGYTPDHGWRGEVQRMKLTPEDEAEGFSEEDVNEDGEPCFLLWPG